MSIPWGTILTGTFSLIAFILQRVNASNNVIAQFQALVNATKDEGLITQQASDKFTDLHGQLMQKFKDPPKP